MMKLTTIAAMLALSTGSALAQCEEITFSDVGWTDITATTAATTVVLEALGYETDIKVLSRAGDLYLAGAGRRRRVPRQLDADDGGRHRALPRGRHRRDGARQPGRREIHARHQRAPAADLGIDQLRRHRRRIRGALDGKIYGIEPGNDGNRLILDMIEEDAFGLSDFEVVESSEQGMLAQVARADRRGEPVVFLGWEPHPMNANFDLTYLEGGDDWFGPDLGGATVYTNVREGFVEECPNVGKLLQNLDVHAADGERDHGRDPGRRRRSGREAATAWLKENPDVLDGWLDGVTTLDGAGRPDGGASEASASEQDLRGRRGAAGGIDGMPSRRAAATHAARPGRRDTGRARQTARLSRPSA